MPRFEAQSFVATWLCDLQMFKSNKLGKLFVCVLWLEDLGGDALPMATKTLACWAHGTSSWLSSLTGFEL